MKTTFSHFPLRKKKKMSLPFLEKKCSKLQEDNFGTKTEYLPYAMKGMENAMKQ